jgi:divalent metal cation (Fe/Co/Zn/Cd) transporter
MGPSGLGVSLVLIAVGAIMRWAVTVHNPHGFNINTAGLILLIVGIVGLIASAAYMATRRRTNVIHEGPVGASRTTYSEPPPPAD